MNITLGQLQKVIGDKTQTRTIHYAYVQRSMEIDENWIVKYLHVDEKNTLEIYCEKQ